MGDSKVTKRCAKCGAVMHDVSVARKYCDFCRFGYATNDPVLPLAHPKYTGPTLQEIMREATKEGLQYAEYCKKNTDCTNHIKELWKVFTKEGKELISYTIRGEGEDEEECTKQLLAYENHCYPNQIHVHTEMR